MITAAASKYTSTVPIPASIVVPVLVPMLVLVLVLVAMVRNESGKIPGASVATTLYAQATPVPIAIRVNMFRFQVRTEAQPRTKKGHPAHSTTGVASTSCSHVFTVAGMTSSTAGNRWLPISRSTTGTASATPTQNRRVMSASSGLGPLSAVTSTGSSAIPQIGHDPGPGRRISGCIGQVHSATSPAEGAPPAGCAGTRPLSAAWTRPPWSPLLLAPVYRSGAAANAARQCSEQKWY